MSNNDDLDFLAYFVYDSSLLLTFYFNVTMKQKGRFKSQITFRWNQGKILQQL